MDNSKLAKCWYKTVHMLCQYDPENEKREVEEEKQKP